MSENQFREDRPLVVYLNAEASAVLASMGIGDPVHNEDPRALIIPSRIVVLEDHARSDYAITGFSNGRYFYFPLDAVLLATQA